MRIGKLKITSFGPKWPNVEVVLKCCKVKFMMVHTEMFCLYPKYRCEPEKGC